MEKNTKNQNNNNNNVDAENDENFEDQEQMLDDDYLIQLHRYLQEKKLERKQAEQEANKLDGRVKMLKGEEEKNLKKIEVTRRKTDKKMAQQAKNEEDFRQFAAKDDIVLL